MRTADPRHRIDTDFALATGTRPPPRLSERAETRYLRPSRGLDAPAAPSPPIPMRR